MVAAPVWASAHNLQPAPATRASHNDGSTPAPKKDDRFEKAHQANLDRAKQGPVGLLFLGDSITAHWTSLAAAKKVFEARYGKYQPANFGIGGDMTQNVLWRLDHGELDTVRPKVVVLLIGTNNSAANTSEEIAAAIGKIVGEVKEKSPASKVLLLGIFPRGPHKAANGTTDDGAQRNEVIRGANAIISKLDDGKTVRYLDIGGKFKVDGKIPDALMPDQLHPSGEGYQIWADAMQPLLDEMMKE